METAITTEDKPVVVTPVAATVVPAFVPLTKEETDKLTKERDDARILQGQADARAARLQAALTGKGGSRFVAPGAAPAAPTEQEKLDYAVEEDRKAVQGLQRLALDPAYRAALDADPTLRGLFQNNPLAVLPLLAPAAYDAEDAVTLVKQALAEKAGKVTATVVTPPVEVKPVVVVPGAIAPVSAEVLDEQYESAKKLPNIESALHSMIGIGLKKMTGKNGS